MSEIIVLFISEIILQNKNSPLPKWRDLETGSRWLSQSERRPCVKKDSDWWRQGNIFKCGMRLIKLLKDPLEGDDYCSVAMINIFLPPSLLRLLISGPAWSRIIRWWQHISFVKRVSHSLLKTALLRTQSTWVMWGCVGIIDDGRCVMLG